MLEVEGIQAGYGGIQVLRGVSFRVDRGEIVSLVGSNGAGKTTLLRTVSGVLPRTAGTVTFEGEDLGGCKPWEITDRGLIQVAQNRLLFPSMTVMENLELGAYCTRARAERKATLESVFDLFPRLKERWKQAAGTLSGGEQQMLAVGRALMSLPKLLMLDEPSFGLSPILQLQLFEKIEHVRLEGISVLVIEQNVNLAMQASDRGYVMENGEIVLQGDAHSLLHDERVREAYLGM